MGKQAAQEVAQTMGFVNNAGLESYVSAIGMKMAKASERPDLPWEFHVVDDAAVNAFALPGGFIYVTRGLLTSINDEAELATVMGHEIGHVTAPPFGGADEQGPAGPARPGPRERLLAPDRPVRRGREPGSPAPLPQVRADRGEPGRRAGLPLRAEPELRRARDGQRLRHAGAGEQRGRRRTGARVALDPPRSGEPGDRYPGPARHPVAQPEQHDHQPGRVPAAHRRAGLRGRSAAGLLRGEHLLPPGDAVPDHLPAGVEDPECPDGGRRGEPQAGRDHPARPGGQDLAPRGGKPVPEPAGDPGGRRVHPEHQRQRRRDQLLPGPDGAGEHRRHRVVHLLRRADLRPPGLRRRAAVRRLRERDQERDRLLRPAQEPGRAEREAEPCRAGAAPPGHDAERVQPGSTRPPSRSPSWRSSTRWPMRRTRSRRGGR